MGGELIRLPARHATIATVSKFLIPPGTDSNCYTYRRLLLQQILVILVAVSLPAWAGDCLGVSLLLLDSSCLLITIDRSRPLDHHRSQRGPQPEKGRNPAHTTTTARAPAHGRRAARRDGDRHGPQPTDKANGDRHAGPTSRPSRKAASSSGRRERQDSHDTGRRATGRSDGERGQAARAEAGPDSRGNGNEMSGHQNLH
jgi:hypothetical protein